MLKVTDSVPMTEEQTKLWINISFLKDESVLDEFIDNVHGCKVIQKRIDVLKLPIEFDRKAMATLSVLCDYNVGRMVVSLIDILDAGIEKVILPERNKKDFSDLPKEVTRSLKFEFVSSAEEVLPIALIRA